MLFLHPRESLGPDFRLDGGRRRRPRVWRTVAILLALGAFMWAALIAADAVLAGPV